MKFKQITGVWIRIAILITGYLFSAILVNAINTIASVASKHLVAMNYNPGPAAIFDILANVFGSLNVFADDRDTVKEEKKSQSKSLPQWLNGPWEVESINEAMMGGRWSWNFRIINSRLIVDNTDLNSHPIQTTASRVRSTGRYLVFDLHEKNEPDYTYVLEVNSQDCLSGTWTLKIDKRDLKPGELILLGWGNIRLTRSGKECRKEPLRSHPIQLEDKNH